MKVTLDFTSDELEPILAVHLDTGESVQEQIKLAVRLYNFLLAKEKEGFAVGYGNADRFRSYNKQISIKEGKFGDSIL